MTLDEKLKTFYDLAVDDAKKDADRTLDEYRALLDKHLEEHKKQKDKMAEQAVLHDRTKLEREMNRRLSDRQFEIRKELSDCENTLADKLFADIEDRLRLARKKPEYLDFLCRKVRKIREMTKGESVEWYIDKEDAPLLPSLKEKAGIDAVLSDEDLMGGILAVCRPLNIRIDESFRSALNTERSRFVIE